MKNHVIYKLFSFTIVLLISLSGYAQNTVTGVLVDEESGEAIIGANILVAGTAQGTISDIDGRFSLTTATDYPFTVQISYTGYESKDIRVTEDVDLGNIFLALSSGLLDEVIVSASRKKEKVQEAPASVSVLGERQLATTPHSDAVRNLLNVPGVQLQQQSAGRTNIEMRGGASVFDTKVLPMKDYRSLAAPGVNTFDSPVIGSSIDLERIEIVRGAGSALYGPGVSTGVVHFISKSPIDHPGTTVELLGGELNTFSVALRHAGKTDSDKFGYKVNFKRVQGDEFTLDPNDPDDAIQIAKFKRQIVSPIVSNGHVDSSQPGRVLLTEEDLDPDGDGNMMRDDYLSTIGEVTFEFRPQDDLNITLHGGFLIGESVFYNDQGEGLTQSTEYWTQARFQKGGLFGQLYYVNNNGGTEEKPIFLYQAGNITPSERSQLEAQLQYNFTVPSFLNADFTTGFDYRQTSLNSNNLVYGRYEDDDDYGIYGGYLQGKFELGKKLDLVLAGRYDQFSFLDESAFSPRAALVFKADPKNTFRVSYNKATIPPSALNMFIDFPVNVPATGILDFWLLGQQDIQTFSDNPMIDVSIPGVPDLPYGTPGLPLAVPYGAVAADVIAATLAAFSMDPSLAPLVPALQQFFSTYVPGGVTGQLIGVNVFDGSLLNDLVPTIPGVISTATTYELGYTGLINDKLKVSVDIYNIHNNGSSDFTQISPLMQLIGSDVPGDLNATVAADVSAFLQTQGLDPATAGAIAAQVGAGFGAGGAAFDGQVSALYPIFGAVETQQTPDDNLVHVATGYRIFDSSFDYWGADIGLEYYVNDAFSIFANYSWTSDEVFETKQSEDSDVTFDTYLGAPSNKYRIGVNYYPSEPGIRGQLAFQHDDEFRSNFGNFSGIAEAKNIVDGSIGYKFSDNLSVDVTGTNILNNEFRAFPNMPKIGRRILGKLTFTF